ncbi:MAG: isochorismatase family protein [Polyangiaceae bacterium]
MSVERTKPSTTAVIIIDVQEKLVPTMPAEQMEQLKRAARIMLGGARELGAHILCTEQYPRGLGHTISPLRDWLEEAQVTATEKLSFSACKEPRFVQELKDARIDSAIVLGLETHICVFQTVRDLAARGIRVQVPIDGVASRREDHRQVGLKLCERAGATLTTAETILFDWMVQSGTDTFKVLSKLVR